MDSYLVCKDCGARWVSRNVRELVERGERCLACDGELEEVPGLPDVDRVDSEQR